MEQQSTAKKGPTLFTINSDEIKEEDLTLSFVNNWLGNISGL